MRVLVCGSRHFNDYKLLEEKLDEIPEITEIIHGAARGADTLAGRYSDAKSIRLAVYPADWNKFGKAAGPIRNTQMLVEGKPDLVVAFMFKDSRGTKNMVEQAKKAGVKTEVINCEDNSRQEA